jgi:hypothetical protein
LLMPPGFGVEREQDLAVNGRSGRGEWAKEVWGDDLEQFRH